MGVRYRDVSEDSDQDYAETANENNESDEDDESTDSARRNCKVGEVSKRPVSIQPEPDGKSEESNDLTAMEVETEPEQVWEAAVADYQNFNFQENVGITQNVMNL
ncbi:hypothetical protein Trydic_g20970 [Trypoxylus dichotomus]